MAQRIKLKRSSTPGEVPTTSQLELGEIAVNTHDGKIYLKKDDGTELIMELTLNELGTGVEYSSSVFAPSSPSGGDLWFDGNTNTLKVWNGTDWNTFVSNDFANYLTTTLTSQINDGDSDNATSIGNLSSTLTSQINDGDSDNATSIGNLSSTLTQDYYTKTEIDGNIGSVISSIETLLNTKIDSDYTTIKTIQSSIEGKYSVTIDANGAITGYELISGGGTSAFNVRADQFAVQNASGVGIIPFGVYTTSRTVNGDTYPAGTYIDNAFIGNTQIVGTLSADKIKIDNITLDSDGSGTLLIKDSGVNTLKISPNSVTVTDSRDFTTVLGPGPYEFDAYINMDYDGDIIAICNVTMFGYSPDVNTIVSYALYIDSDKVYSYFTGGATTVGAQSLSGTRPAVAGTRLVKIIVNDITGIVNPGASCNMTIFRRYR